MSPCRRGDCKHCGSQGVPLAGAGTCWSCYRPLRRQYNADAYYCTWWRLATVRVYQLRAKYRQPIFDRDRR